jgi:hypothetical protein
LERFLKKSEVKVLSLGEDYSQVVSFSGVHEMLRSLGETKSGTIGVNYKQSEK